MSWVLKEKPKTVRVTKSLAAEHRDKEELPRERTLSERRLMIYERLFKAGQFRPVTWATCLCKETGTTYRVNGKHTSTLLSGMESLPEFYVTLEHYEADTLQDVANLYSTFDSKTQSRTAQDINLSFASVVPELKDLPSKIINLAIIGIAYANHQQGAWSIPTTERAEALLDHVDFAMWLHNLLGSSRENRFLGRCPVVAAMFQGYSRSRKDATRFWELVRGQAGPKPDLPDRKLARWLMTNSVNKGSGPEKDGKPDSRRASNREFFARCLTAWNAWRKGKPTDLKYFADAKVPTAV